MRSEIKHVLVGFTLLSLLQVFHVNAENVHLAFFLPLGVFCLCLDEVPPRRRTKFPTNVVEIPPNHIHQKKNVFFHIHEINTGGCVVY